MPRSAESTTAVLLTPAWLALVDGRIGTQLLLAQRVGYLPKDAVADLLTESTKSDAS